MMEERYPEISARALPLLDTRHNELHTRVAFRFAEILLQDEGGNPDIVLPAVILHDVGWKSIPPELHTQAFGPGKRDMNLNRVHELAGAEKAREILEDVGYAAGLIEEIVEIIRGHDSRIEPLSLNDAIVKDADKLWRFSAEALTVNPVLLAVDPGDHTRWLGLKIPTWFITPTAENLARREHRERSRSLGVERPHDAGRLRVSTL